MIRLDIASNYPKLIKQRLNKKKYTTQEEL